MNTPGDAQAETNTREMNTPATNTPEMKSKPLAFAAEAVIGLVIAILLVWVTAAAVSDIPFVYQGL